MFNLTRTDVAVARVGGHGFQVSVSYPVAVDPRRGLIALCAEVSRDRCKLWPEMRLTSDGEKCRVVFEFRGKGAEELANEFRERVTASDLDLTLDKPKTLAPLPVMPLDDPNDVETSSVGDTMGRNVRKVVRAVMIARALELANVFTDAAVKRGDRVIINDGQARKPVYLVGTVVKVDVGARRIKVRLDNGKYAEELVNNGPTGLVGFQLGAREKPTAINPYHLQHWLDRRRWCNRHATDLIDKFEGRRKIAA